MSSNRGETDESDSLASLLDIIDSKRRTLPSSSSLSSGSSSVLASSSSVPLWSVYSDPATQLPYYVNNTTLTSQWEKPADFPHTSLVDSLTSNASFNIKTGSISTIGSESYFERQGRPADREGRQMSAFFDLNSFEQNRIEAAEKKRKLQESGVNWREYKEEKKKKRFRMKNSWLYEED